MSSNKQKTALLLLDLQNEMVDPKGKIGTGGGRSGSRQVSVSRSG